MITLNIPPNAKVSPTTYHMGQINSIYNIPKPVDEKYVVAIASFSGGLHCRINSNGVLKSGDCKTYWSNIGIPVEKHPQVIIVPIKGEKNYPNGKGTFENTMDVEIIGGACPSSNLTILLYLTNRSDTFYSLFSYIYENPFVLNGITYKPNVITCCWNIPEELIKPVDLNRCNDLFKKITDSGTNICIASGDKPAIVTFPASSPYVTAVGGTTLTCPTDTYTSSTIETVWNRTSSGTSKIFPKPNYQRLSQNSDNRCIPDIALCANPSTGVLLYYNSAYVTGGGTSAAAPIFSGYLAAIGCKQFVNPLLYSASKDCYHDIVKGSNGKYVAKTGPDLCTGLGSIDGTRLKSVLSKVEPPKVEPPFVKRKKRIEPPKVEPQKIECNKIIDAVPVLSIRINITKYTLKPKNTIQLVASVLPHNATNGSIQWTSSTKNAKVDQSGLVTAISTGSTIITARSMNGDKLATCEIVVL
jgi:kumamolisin